MIQKRSCAEDENLHSKRARGFSLTKSGKVSFVREATSEADATAAPTSPRARVVKGRISTVCI